ncbi:MAG: hypothetical protein ABFS37_05090 [Acidobacteriota bacterium]
MMTTSTESLALAIAEGRATPEESAQAECDPKLGALVTGFRKLLGALDDARTTADVPPALMHWARAWAHEATERPQTFVSRILGILAYGAPQLAAVRGMTLGGSAVLYGDDDHQLDIRLEPQHDGTCRVRGQVVPTANTGDSDSGPWTVRLVGFDGAVMGTRSDEIGDFRFDALPDVKSLSLIAERGSKRLIVPRLVTPMDEVEAEGTQTGDHR